ncbi:STAS domain-containing protein [Streptomyces sp. BB1-1-1]|uniref:STAS domain-containing protein n=1 Tax=Streptomyces sp. BB1-1-1 TaxID=3074430 RepID=UPI00287779C9|nr:STAS domain-containing protein [Streptomyces sp. BB1-1-1]WND33060.1 STAS domain-containing protein [Streptomyces sp. BB1-1-1]
MNPLHITTRDATTGPVLEVIGDLEYATAHQLREHVSALILRPGQRLVLDLGRLDFCDSSGITALIAAHNRATAAEAELALAAVPDNTLRILRIVGLDQVFPFFADTDTATTTT